MVSLHGISQGIIRFLLQSHLDCRLGDYRYFVICTMHYVFMYYNISFYELLI